MWKRLPFISIKTKIVLICLVVIIVPVFVMTLNYYISSQHLLERKYKELLTDIVKQTNIRIDEFLNEIEKISLVASYGLNSNSSTTDESFPVQDYLRGGNGANGNAAYTMLMNYIQMKDRVFSIYIYNLNGGQDLLVSSYQPFDYTYKVLDEQWFRTFIHSDQKILTLQTHADKQLKNKLPVISHARKIFDMTSGKLIGVMVISMDIKIIDRVNSRLQEHLRPNFIIADDRGVILYNVDRTKIGEPMEGILQTVDEDYIEVSSPLDKMNWTTYLYTPLRDLSTEGNTLKRNIYLLASLMVLFSIIISLYLSNVITRPIKKLMKNIMLVEKGEFELAEENHSRDEIGHLSVRFTKMSYELKQMVSRIQQDEVDKAEAEIRALQSQINPHFLYNTLGSVKWIASMQRVEKIVEMTDALIAMLRYAARAGGEMVTIREELDNMGNYLRIQNVRYYNRIQLLYEVDELLLDCLVPKLILQPIVENAIFHGIAEKEDDGVITIRIYREGNDMTLEIEDNGAGMDEETIRSLREKGIQPPSINKGIGLYNVERRIQLYFGIRYGISFVSERGVGTIFRISLPATRGRSDVG